MTLCNSAKAGLILVLIFLLNPIDFNAQTKSGNELLRLLNNPDEVYLKLITSQGFSYDRDVEFRHENDNSVFFAQKFRRESSSESIYKLSTECSKLLNYSKVEVTSNQYKLLEDVKNDLMFLGFEIVHEADTSETQRRVALKNEDGTFVDIWDMSQAVTYGGKVTGYSSWMEITLSKDECK